MDRCSSKPWMSFNLKTRQLVISELVKNIIEFIMKALYNKVAELINATVIENIIDINQFQMCKSFSALMLIYFIHYKKNN